MICPPLVHLGAGSSKELLLLKMIIKSCSSLQLSKIREEDRIEMDELREQHHKAITALSAPVTSSSNVFTDLYHDTLQKNDHLRKDYDDIRQRYADLMAQHSAACSQLKDMDVLRKQVNNSYNVLSQFERVGIAFYNLMVN